MGVQITSLIAFEQILNSLGERQELIFKAIRKLQPCSNMELSKYLNLPINQITPRNKELRSKGLIIYYKKDQCKYTNRLVMYWKIPEWINGMIEKQEVLT